MSNYTHLSLHFQLRLCQIGSSHCYYCTNTANDSGITNAVAVFAPYLVDFKLPFCTHPISLSFCPLMWTLPIDYYSTSFPSAANLA
jgi:hypothetical protein